MRSAFKHKPQALKAQALSAFTVIQMESVQILHVIIMDCVRLILMCIS